MVWSSTTYHCEKCRRGHSDYDSARSCELQHIVDDAVSGFSRELDRIFADTRKGRSYD